MGACMHACIATFLPSFVILVLRKLDIFYFHSYFLLFDIHILHMKAIKRKKKKRRKDCHAVLMNGKLFLDWRSSCSTSMAFSLPTYRFLPHGEKSNPQMSGS